MIIEHDRVKKLNEMIDNRINALLITGVSEVKLKNEIWNDLYEYLHQPPYPFFVAERVVYQNPDRYEDVLSYIRNWKPTLDFIVTNS